MISTATRSFSRRFGTKALLVFAMFLAVAALACGSNTNETANKQSSPTPRQTPSPSPASTKATTATATTGNIEVKSTPSGAAVMLISREEDSVGAPESKGTTPAMITGIAPGKYTVDVEMNGYKYYQKEIEVKEGGTVRVDAKLKKQ